MDDHTFPACISLAATALEGDDYRTALREYEAAIDNATSVDERAEALRMIGVTYRAMRNITRAANSLRQALRLASGNEELVARIQRDLAMTAIDDLTPNETDLFFEIMVLLEKSKSALPEGSSDYWATVGFIGRAHLLYGNPAEARNAMMSADDGLRAQQSINQVYERNNLKWLMLTEPLPDRLRHGVRAWRLMRQTGQSRPKRWLELVVIVIGGDRFYRLARRRRK